MRVHPLGALVDATVLTLAAQVVPATAASPTCLGRSPTIVGTAGADVFCGTGRADVIVARGGADAIYGGGRRDIICGGGERDKIYGGARSRSSTP